jgi:hypothetical protein
MTPSKEELASRYQKLPDQKLLDIIHHKNDYRPEALDAAIEELKQRNTSTESVTRYVESKKDHQVRKEENAKVPLPLHMRMLFFFAWFITIFFGSAYRLNYHEDGMLKKLRQSSFYSITGIVSLAITTFLAVAFDMPNLASIGVLAGLFCVFYVLEEYVLAHNQ